LVFLDLQEAVRILVSNGMRQHYSVGVREILPTCRVAEIPVQQGFCAVGQLAKPVGTRQLVL